MGVVRSDVPWFSDGGSDIVCKSNSTASNASNFTTALAQKVAYFLQLPISAVRMPFDSDTPSPLMNFPCQLFEVIPHKVKGCVMTSETRSKHRCVPHRVHIIARTPPNTGDRGPQKALFPSFLRSLALIQSMSKACLRAAIMVPGDLLNPTPLTRKNLHIAVYRCAVFEDESLWSWFRAPQFVPGMRTRGRCRRVAGHCGLW